MSAVLTPSQPATMTPPPGNTRLLNQTPASTELLDDLPLQAMLAGLRRISVSEYHAMIEHGILQSGERVELLDGYLVNKMPKNPPHVIALSRLRKLLEALLPNAW